MNQLIDLKLASEQAVRDVLKEVDYVVHIANIYGAFAYGSYVRNIAIFGDSFYNPEFHEEFRRFTQLSLCFQKAEKLEQFLEYFHHRLVKIDNPDNRNKYIYVLLDTKLFNVTCIQLNEFNPCFDIDHVINYGNQRGCLKYYDPETHLLSDTIEKDLKCKIAKMKQFYVDAVMQFKGIKYYKSLLIEGYTVIFPHGNVAVKGLNCADEELLDKFFETVKEDKAIEMVKQCIEMMETM